MSLSNFINTFSKTVTERSLKTLSSIFKYHNYYFPPTEATKSGSQNQRLIDELRLNQNRLLANTDINLIKVFLLDLINAAELGQIIDNRPKKN
jgi:hypothetical protein